ncbi:MAG: hypothetical protein MJ214_02980 [Bacilli bacterium]|nr:hypothetical protein [Bacilli bacterium]
MGIKKENYQKHTFYTVKNQSGLEITFCNYGASIYAIKYKGQYVTYHEEDYDAFLNSKKFAGKTLGRVAGRIKNGILKINRDVYQLERNDNNNTMHSGVHSISFKDFDASLSESDELINVVFKYTSPSNEAGLPHEVRFIVVYSIMKKENKFSIHYRANATGLTPVSMAPHIYWRLGDKDVLNHRLTINADNMTKLDQELIILGKEKVKPIYDFRNEKRIGQDILAVAKDNPTAGGYDCGFIFNKSDKPQVILKNAGIKLSIKTDMEMAIVYTNCTPGQNKINGYGKDIKYGGVAIEPQMREPLSKAKLIDPKHPFDHYISFHLEDY